MTTYNGHKNWDYWNVSLWINNDEGLYNEACQMVRIYKSKARAAKHFCEHLQARGITKTPDDAKYTIEKVKAAMTGM